MFRSPAVLILSLAALLLASALPAAAQELTQIQTVRDGADGLAGARAIAVSPDGLHAYVAGTAEDSIAIFGRDFFLGEWMYLGKQTDGAGGVDGLDGVIDVAVSPDGLRVYAVGENDDAIAVFERSASTGLLSFEGAIRDGEAGANLLDRPIALSIVPSGPFEGRVYVVSFAENAVTAFDPDFPTLDWVGSWQDGVGGVDGMAGPIDLVALAGADGPSVYVVSSENALAVFAADFLGSFAQRQVLRDGEFGVDGLQGPTAITAHPNGEHVYVAAGGESTVASFLRDTNDGLLAFDSLDRNGVGGVFGIGGVLGIAAEPDGDFVYATSGGFSISFNFVPQIATFEYDGFELDLDFVDATNLAAYSSFVFYVPPARIGIAFPNAEEALVTHPVFSTLTVHARSASTGELTPIATLEDGAGVTGVAGAQSVVASPDGTNVYVLGRDEAVVTEFARDPATGALSFAGTQQTTGFLQPITPPYRNATMSPDAKHLYVFDYRQNRIGVYRRDVTPGRLTKVQDVVSNSPSIPPFLQFNSGAVNPDGTRLYVLSPVQNAISVFARDPSDGSLFYLATRYESPDLGLGMLQPRSIVASTNGDVYVGGSANLYNPIWIRFSTAGAVLASGVLPYSSGQPDCGGRSLAMHPSQAYLIAGQEPNTVCAYFRDANGSLARRSAATVPGKTGPVHSLAVHPSGTRVYASLYDGNHPTVGHSALAVFGFDAVGESLSLLETLSDQSEGVDDTQGLVSIAVSPDGRHVYGAAYLDDAVVAFVPEPGAVLAALAAFAALRARLPALGARRSRRGGPPTRPTSRSSGRRSGRNAFFRG